MGDNLYTEYWETVLPNIIDEFKKGKAIIELPVRELENVRERDSYYTNFRIINGELEKPRGAQAYGRDLFGVLSSNEYFQNFFSNKTISINISKDLLLTMEITDTNSPAFFSKEDFVELSRFPKQTMDNNNPEHKKTYTQLKETYNKVEYWANAVQQNIFPEGLIQIRKRPTNQANKFEEYQWAKIYPTQSNKEFEILAFTVGIDTDNRFTVKIDTVGLNESNSKRQFYLQQRGDFNNSEIVKNFPYEQVLDKGWKYLIDLSSNIILSMKPAYDKLLQSFQNAENPAGQLEELKDNHMPLNTILYGPPGTGKTYNSINKALEILGENVTDKSRQEIKSVFEKKVQEGRIVFTTFHQSMSYEDFIEGIKPIKPQPGESVKYDIEDGIFKSLCKTAISNYANAQQKNNAKLRLRKHLKS